MAEIKMDAYYEFYEFFENFDLSVSGHLQMVAGNLEDEDVFREIMDCRYWNVEDEGGIIKSFRKEILHNLMLNFIDKKEYLEEIYYYGIMRLFRNYNSQQPLFKPLTEFEPEDEWNKKLEMIRPVFFYLLDTLKYFSYEVHQIADGRGISLLHPELTLEKFSELRLNIETHNYLKFIHKNELDKEFANYLDRPARNILQHDGEKLVCVQNPDWLGEEEDITEEIIEPEQEGNLIIPKDKGKYIPLPSSQNVLGLLLAYANETEELIFNKNNQDEIARNFGYSSDSSGRQIHDKFFKVYSSSGCRIEPGFGNPSLLNKKSDKNHLKRLDEVIKLLDSYNFQKAKELASQEKVRYLQNYTKQYK